MRALPRTELDRAKRLMEAQARRARHLRPARQRESAWRRPSIQSAAGGARAGQARSRPCLCEGADRRPRRPRRDHGRQSGADRRPRRCSPPSSPMTASMPISKSTSRPICAACAPMPRRSSQEQKHAGRSSPCRATPRTPMTARSKASTTRSTPAPARSAPAPASPTPTARWCPACSCRCAWAAATTSKVILVPEDAIGNDQSKRFVFVVDAGPQGGLSRGRARPGGGRQARRALGPAFRREDHRRRRAARAAGRRGRAASRRSRSSRSN